MKIAILIGLALAAAGAGMARVDASPVVLAQAEIRIPSDAELDRMERKAIATPPLDVRDAPALKGSERRQDLEMDRQDVIIDQKVMQGICADCE